MKILLSVVFITHLLSAIGQTTSIKVHSGADALPYAYIYINGKIRGAADSLGTTTIDPSQLKLGDTIAASYVGRNTTFTIYDGKERYELDLSEDNNIPPVVVIPSIDYTHFFTKQVKTLQLPKFYQETKGDFNIYFWKSGRSVEGTVTIAPIYVYAGNYSLESELSLRSDTTSVSKTVDQVAYYMHLTELYTDISKHRYLNKGMRVLDEGKDNDGLCVYSIIRPYSTESRNAQVRIYIDPESRILRKAYIFSPDPQLTTVILAEFQTSGNIIFPMHIKVELFRDYISDAPDVTYTIDNITLSPPVFRKYKKRQKELYIEYKQQMK